MSRSNQQSCVDVLKDGYSGLLAIAMQLIVLVNCHLLAPPALVRARALECTVRAGRLELDARNLGAQARGDCSLATCKACVTLFRLDCALRRHVGDEGDCPARPHDFCELDAQGWSLAARHGPSELVATMREMQVRTGCSGRAERLRGP